MAKARVKTIDSSKTYVLSKIDLPICCFICKNLIAVENKVMGIIVIDCKKKIFFPTKKRSCLGREL